MSGPIMERSTFENTTVSLDGVTFIGCAFRGCKLVFSATAPVSLQSCSFDNCTWEFRGAAGQTLEFLRAMYHGMGAGGRQLVETTFGQVRGNKTFVN